MRKELGKIKEIALRSFEGQFGLDVLLTGIWGSCNWHLLTYDTEYNERCQWTEKDRDNGYIEIMIRIRNDIKTAKVNSLDKLRGIPVECTFDGNTIVSWRVLEEVL